MVYGHCFKKFKNAKGIQGRHASLPPLSPCFPVPLSRSPLHRKRLGYPPRDSKRIYVQAKSKHTFYVFPSSLSPALSLPPSRPPSLSLAPKAVMILKTIRGQLGPEKETARENVELKSKKVRSHAKSEECWDKYQREGKSERESRSKQMQSSTKQEETEQNNNVKKRKEVQLLRKGG